MKINKCVLLYLFLLIFSLNAFSQNDECLDCHGDEEESKIRGGKEISLFVDEMPFTASIHGDMECIECHMDFNADEEPHRAGEDIYKVDCGDCHDDEEMPSGIHNPDEVQCFECHSKHEILEAQTLHAEKSEFCISCHNNRKTRSYNTSIHNQSQEPDKVNATCLDCHNGKTHDITKADFSDKELHNVCRSCHEPDVNKFENSLHGSALAAKKYLAPDCIKCHGDHGIKSSDNPLSKTYRMNIPSMCGECHKDGTSVSELKNISKSHILSEYSQSIHGNGLFKRGLIVTAVCTDCHFTHDIQPHEKSTSSINRNNIATTCMQCHVQIEEVHLQVIRGELWEKQPHLIPACIDCHNPHEIRKVFYEEDFSDEKCYSCHGKPDLGMDRDGEIVSLYVDSSDVVHSAHKNETCVKCHTNVSISRDPVCRKSGKVDCSGCHAETAEDYYSSKHGKEYTEGDEDAPYCTDCHDTHRIMAKDNMNSPIFSMNIPELCGQCHRKGEKAAVRIERTDGDIIENYTMSIHGKGLLSSGLTVTATCVNCHTAHSELPAADSLSTVNRANIAETCSVCHLGVYEEYRTSIHSPEVSNSEEKLPECIDCHKSHTIQRVDVGNFRGQIMEQCGECHKEVTVSYFETFHGKVSKLGALKSAKCYDCHGSHKILPPVREASTLSPANIVNTCNACHPGSNLNFVGYLTHANHNDKDKYPSLYYTYFLMSALLIGVFAFFGLHTLLWLPRALIEERKKKKTDQEEEN